MEATLRATWVVWYRELLRFLQERARLISSFVGPLMFLVIFGAGFKNALQGSASLPAGWNYVQFLYPGIIAMNTLMTSVMSGVSVVWDREFGFLKEILVAPLGRTGIVLGKAVGAATIAVGQGLILLILAPIPWIGVTITPRIVLLLIPMLIALAVSLSGLGVLIASRMRSQQGFQLIFQIIIFPLIFLAGVFFPVSGVPSWLSVISKINPITYGVAAIRELFLSALPSSPGVSALLGVTIFGHTLSMLEDVLVVIAFGVVMLALAAWSFGRQD